MSVRLNYQTIFNKCYETKINASDYHVKVEVQLRLIFTLKSAEVLYYKKINKVNRKQEKEKIKKTSDKT